MAATYTYNNNTRRSTGGYKHVGTSRAHKAMFDSEYDYLFKFLVVGDSGVGKSCLVERFSEGRFSKTFVPTIGVDFKIRSLNTSRGKKVKLQIWDTAGQERFRAITASYYRGGNAIVLCYDTTDRNTFEHLRMWLKEIRAYARHDCHIMIVGTKTDLSNKIKCEALRRRVGSDATGAASTATTSTTTGTVVDNRTGATTSYTSSEHGVDDCDIWWTEREDATAFAKELGVPLVRCSAKMGDGVEELFTEFAESLVKEHTAQFPTGRTGQDGTVLVHDGDRIKVHNDSGNGGVLGFMSRLCFS